MPGGRGWPALAAAALLFLLLGPAPLLLPDPAATDFAAILVPPSPAHLLGTDQLGRDVLARVVVGARLTLGLAAVSVVVTGVVGVGVGLVTGYVVATRPAGVAAGVARLVMRGVDVVASLPAILLGLVAAAALGPGVGSLLVAVIAVGWTPFARHTHQLTVAATTAGHVRAATALGAGTARVLGRHVLPSLTAPLVAHAGVRFASALMTVSGLSFLGMGVPPPAPEWGAMVAEGRAYLFSAPHVVLAPSVAVVAVAVVAAALGRRAVGRGGTR